MHDRIVSIIRCIIMRVNSYPAQCVVNLITQSIIIARSDRQMCLLASMTKTITNGHF